MSAATLFATLEDSTVGRTRLLGNAALLQGQYPDGHIGENFEKTARGPLGRVPSPFRSR